MNELIRRMDAIEKRFADAAKKINQLEKQLVFNKDSKLQKPVKGSIKSKKK